MSSGRDMVPISIRDPFFKDPFFSSTWEEFDKMRQDMISTSKDFWGKVDKDFANFDEQVKRSHTDMDQSMAVFRPQLPKWAVGSGMPDAGFNTTAFAGRNDEVMKVKQDDNKFEVTLDVSDYKPEELKVTTVNNVLSIEGKHEAKVEDSKDTGDARAFGSSAVMKQFSRKWTLPTDSDPADVISNLSSDGVLMVTAPRKNTALKSNVPIKAINIEGKQEAKVEDSKDTGNVRAFGSSAVMKQFNQKWTLPTDSDPANVVSNLSSDGILMVTAPRKNAVLQSNVPIKAIK